jgi:hypothetical protein
LRSRRSRMVKKQEEQESRGGEEQNIRVRRREKE